MKHLFFIAALLILSACNNNSQETPEQETSSYERIISLKGVYTEILFDLGLSSKIVGVDVTSAFPEAAKSIESVGHISGITASGLASLNPDLILYPEGELSAEVVEQLNQLGIKTIGLEQEYSIDGAKSLVRKIAEITGTVDIAESKLAQFDKEIVEFKATKSSLSVCFIYARGAGTLMVGGGNTPMGALIKLVGATNPFEEYDGFVPLNSEAMAVANPDVLFVFESGLQSLGGESGLLSIEGVTLTKAAKSKQIVVMDGSLVSHFALRLPLALSEFQKQLQAFQ